ncbi:hypothetical protein BPIT_17100 [Candidatus Brocadia pituitae]|nr:hypothetical protein BPIT_17100 [Candidatus Brocadia pituitae]
MSPEKRCMIGKEYGLNTFVDKNENAPDKRQGIEVTEKAVDNLHKVGMDRDCIDVGGDGYGVKPPHTLPGKQET